MSKTKSSTKKAASSAKTTETKAMSYPFQQVFALISSGHLPPADTITHDGQPTWSFETLAVILGCDPQDLANLLRGGVARFTVEPGTGSS
jgi:hypothetical protein